MPREVGQEAGRDSEKGMESALLSPWAAPEKVQAPKSIDLGIWRRVMRRSAGSSLLPDQALC